MEPAMHPTDEVLDPDKVRARLAAELPHWRLEDGLLCRRYRTGGWRATLMVVNVIGHLAEAGWHHPDLAVSYATVDVRLSTHSAGGITGKDFALARQIEAVVGWRPQQEPGNPLEGPPQGDPAQRYIVHDGAA
jgi:4a-hydroxytetrahydrobiopterin dehydratase